jgi:small-conductance mechanosensitive channel
LKQWDVRREMLRRIKDKFDELGIAIAFPQEVVHVRSGPNGRPLGNEEAQHWEAGSEPSLSRPK